MCGKCVVLPRKARAQVRVVLFWASPCIFVHNVIYVPVFRPRQLEIADSLGYRVGALSLFVERY